MFFIIPCKLHHLQFENQIFDSFHTFYLSSFIYPPQKCMRTQSIAISMCYARHGLRLAFCHGRQFDIRLYRANLPLHGLPPADGMVPRSYGFHELGLALPAAFVSLLRPADFCLSAAAFAQTQKRTGSKTATSSLDIGN